mgnify:CR=1 FL=1
MSRIQSTFAALGGEKALISYITAGDPDKETTLGLMHSLAANGADIIELGVPFSDPGRRPDHSACYRARLGERRVVKRCFGHRARIPPNRPDDARDIDGLFQSRA